MTTFIALLRAVNVGGTGKLGMEDLKILCEGAGFAKVRTYIASGNVMFQSRASEAEVKAALQASLQAHTGRAAGVLVRTLEEMESVLAANPFAHRPPSRTLTLFLDRAPPHDALEHVSGRSGEEIELGAREIYVHYPDGVGGSKLTIAAAKAGTARNINTVAKLAALAREL